MSEKARLIKLDPNKIEIPKVRVTSVWEDDDYKAFQDSLAADGILNPILCIKENDTFWLVDGLHRLQEAKLNGSKTVEVVYREGTLADAMLKNLYGNRLRGKPSSLRKSS